MSGIRDKARSIIDAALPPNAVITFDGSTAAKYKEMTGLSQEAWAANWAKGGHLSGCMGFTGWYGVRMGSKKYLGGFDLKHLAVSAGKPDAWIASTMNNRPQYGDILRHTAFHVDVAIGFDGGVLLRAAVGQLSFRGGPPVHDIIKRVRGLGPYDWRKLMGWIDIDIYFAST